MVDIKYNWGSGSTSIGISAEVSLPQWKVNGHRPRALEIALSTGNYSRLAMELQFVRSTGYYIMSLYLPAAILVLLSWVPFWINSDAMTSRVLTGVASLVILLQVWQNTTSSLPKISYIKIIDVYFLGCIGLVLLSLIEHALITCFITRRKNYKKSMQNDVSRSRSKPCCLRLAPDMLDWFARLAFPGVFVGLNILYWKYFMTVSEIKMQDFIPTDKNF